MRQAEILILVKENKECCEFTMFIFVWERQATEETFKERQTDIERKHRICRELTCQNSKVKLDQSCAREFRLQDDVLTVSVEKEKQVPHCCSPSST